MANSYNRNTRGKRTTAASRKKRNKKLRYRRRLRLLASLLFLTIIVGGVIYLAVKFPIADNTPTLNETNTTTDETASSDETSSSDETPSDETTTPDETSSTNETSSDETTTPDESSPTDTTTSTDESATTDETVSPDETSSPDENTSSDETTSSDVGSGNADVSAYDNTCQNWGPGVNFDELNRPVGAVNEQAKYKDYGAYFIKDTTAKGVYLTFDEGYENGYTSQILDVLKEKNVQAVFFVTLPYVKSQPDLIKRMIAEGHIVGNHSVNHKEGGLPSQSPAEQTNEVMELHQYMLDNYQYEMHLFRFPAGKYSEQSMMSVKNCNYKSLFWSFAYRDFDVENQPEPSTALETLTARLHPGAIYLLHAVSETNTNILGDFIDKAQANGYSFVTF